MKKLFICLLLVSSFFVFNPLKTFAEESNDSSSYVLSDDTSLLTDVQLSKYNELILTVNDYDTIAIFLVVGNGNFMWSYDFSMNDSDSTITYNYRYGIKPDDTSFETSASSTDYYLTNTNVTYFVLKYQGVILHGADVIPTPTPTPTPNPSSGCNAELLQVLSDPILTGLLNDTVLNVDNIEDWFITYTVETSGSATATICQQDGFDYSGFRSGYTIYYKSSGSDSYSTSSSWFDYKLGYNGVGTSDSSGSYCKWTPATSWNEKTSVNVLTKTCYDQVISSLDNPVEVNDSKGNELIESGNDLSKSTSDDLVNSKSELDTVVNDYTEVESALISDFNVNLDNISTDFSWGTSFLNSATFVRNSFDALVEPEPIYNLLLFSLTIGFALFIVGRLRK